jgi:hypothetical protein
MGKRFRSARHGAPSLPARRLTVRARTHRRAV